MRGAMRNALMSVVVWVLAVLAMPFAVVVALYFSLWYGAHKLVEKLDHIDPTPWHQAALLGVALSGLIVLAVL